MQFLTLEHGVGSLQTIYLVGMWSVGEKLSENHASMHHYHHTVTFPDKSGNYVGFQEADLELWTQSVNAFNMN